MLLGGKEGEHGLAHPDLYSIGFARFAYGTCVGYRGTDERDVVNLSYSNGWELPDKGFGAR